MEIPKLKIGNITAEIPIVQGGMGVRVSLSSLASAVANAGGIGTLSSIGLGDFVASLSEYERISREALEYEIRQVKKMTDGPVAVNFMGALSNVNDLIVTSVAEGIKIIVFGAGLPTALPGLVPDPSVNLVPIVSSARVAELIMRVWDKRYGRTPDAFILEGPLAGGHLGFSKEQLAQPREFSLERLLPELLEVLKGYEDKYGRKIPVIAGGGIFDGRDIARMLSLGASGVQMATRFRLYRGMRRFSGIQAGVSGCQGGRHRHYRQPGGHAGPSHPQRFLERVWNPMENLRSNAHTAA